MIQAPAITTTDVYKQALITRLGFSVIEVINNEVISSGFDPSQGNAKILLHCRVEASGTLTFTAKASVSLDNLQANL